MTDLSRLNAQQRQAVRHTEGPLLILAGAGSGKTRVITYRLAHLLKQELVPPQNMLAVTFTNKAAREMRERLSMLAGAEARKVTISTFHSLCLRILRKQAELAGFRKNFVIYDQTDQLSLVREIVKDQALDFAGHNAFTLLGRISNAKSCGDSPSDFQKKDNPEEVLFGDLYEHYLQRTRGFNAVDFDDILILTNQVLEENENVRQFYQNQFRYVMVDEYQDTNHLQFRFIQLILGSHQNICVVGDDDQAIYSWRGADPEIILRFEDSFAGARVIKLEQNYRSSQLILQAANAVISNNKSRHEKQLWSAKSPGVKINVIKASNELEEAESVVAMIQNRRMMNSSLKLGDFAVLVRTNFQLRPLEEAARGANLPYQLIGGSSFYERPEVRSIIAFLKAINNPNDELNLKRALQFPRRGIGSGSLFKLHEYCKTHRTNLFQSFRQAHEMDNLTTAVKHAIEKFVELIHKYQRKFHSEAVSVAATELVHELDFIHALEQSIPEVRSREAKVINVREFLGSIKRFEQTADDKSLSAFIDRISLVSDSDYLNGRDDRAIFLTVHSAKGLEFPIVFLYGMNDGQFPSRKALELGAIEEERRLCYVAITRAQQELTVSYSTMKTRYKEVLEMEPSRFLKEIPDAVFDGTFDNRESPEQTAKREDDDRQEMAAMLKQLRENNFKVN